MPAKVLKRLTRIQRSFLWGGVKGGCKICWVSWRKICHPKNERGWGVKDTKVVNLILLAKWRWRLIQHDNPLWKKVLKEKYGDSIGNLVEMEEVNWP